MRFLATTFSCFLYTGHGRRVQMPMRDVHGRAHGDQIQNDAGMSPKVFSSLPLLQDASAAWQLGFPSLGRGAAARSRSRGAPGLIVDTSEDTLLVKDVKVGQKFDGKVHAVLDYGLMVDIGGVGTYKHSLLHVSELEGSHAALEKVTVGDPITCWALSIDFKRGAVLLTGLELGSRLTLEELKVGQELKGVVESVSEIGLFVSVGAVKPGLLHARGVEGGKAALNKFEIGDSIDCWVRSIDLDRGRFELETHKSKLRLQNLQIGKHHYGIVDRVTDYGAFLDIGAETLGLAYVSEFEDGSDGLAKLDVGDRINCWIKSVNLRRKSLSITVRSPSKTVSLEDLKVDQAVNGAVSVVNDYGVYVNIGADKQALLQVEEFEGGSTVMKELSPGDKIACWVKKINLETREVYLTAREPGTRMQLQELKVGQEFSGVFSKVKWDTFTLNRMTTKALVDIGAEKRASLHETDFTGGGPALKRLARGEAIAGRISSIDLEKGAVNLTVRKPLEELVVGQDIRAIVTKLGQKGVQVDSGIEKPFNFSFLRRSEIKGGNATLKEMRRGDEIMCQITAIDLQNRRVNLTARKPLEKFRSGQELIGAVMRVMGYGAFVDIGADRQALLSRVDMGDASSKPAVGDKIPCWIKSINLENRTAKLTSRKPLEEFEPQEQFYGIVSGIEKFGVFVDIGPRTGLVHVSELAGGRSTFNSISLGDAMPVWIKRIDSKGISLTSREPIERVQLEDLEVGQEFQGTVEGKTEYGAFVDVGAEIEGLLHVNSLQGKQIGLDKLTPGDSITCRIQSIDLKKRKLELTARKPFEEFEIGQEVSGIVAEMIKDGVFVDIGANKWGLLHVSEVEGSDLALKKLKLGSTVTSRILSIDLDRESARLTTRKDENGVRFRLDEVNIGQEFTGVVLGKKEYGAFVDIGADQRCFLHVAQLIGQSIALEALKLGDTIEGRLMSNLSSPQLTQLRPLAEFKVGREVSGVAVAEGKYGTIVDIGAERKALLDRREMLWLENEEGEDYEGLSPGDKINCWIKSLDLEKNRAELSFQKPKLTGAMLSLAMNKSQDQQDRLRLDELRVGQEVSGLISELMDYGVWVDVGAQRRGLIHVTQFDRSRADLDELSIGENITCWVKEVDLYDEKLELTARRPGARLQLEEFKVGQELSGIVQYKRNTAGAYVDIGAEMDGLIRTNDFKGGLVGLRNVNIGDQIKCRIHMIDPEKRVLQLATTRSLETLKVGQQLNGTVKHSTEKGWFVDVGTDSKLAWLHYSKVASEKLARGDLISCWIESIDLQMRSLRVTERTPLEELKIGQECSGIVKDGVRVGVNVDIGAESNGFLHVDRLEGGEASRKRLNSGEKITCWITWIDLEKRTMAFSTRSRLEKLAVGQKRIGTVTNLQPYGAFVDIGMETDGLVPIRMLVGKDAALEKLAPGDKMPCHVVSIDLKNRSVILTNRRPLDELRPGQIFSGTVNAVLEDGTSVVDIGAESDGWLRLSKINGLDETSEKLIPGDTIECQIESINSESRRLSLIVRSKDFILKKSESLASNMEEETVS